MECTTPRDNIFQAPPSYSDTHVTAQDIMLPKKGKHELEDLSQQATFCQWSHFSSSNWWEGEDGQVCHPLKEASRAPRRFPGLGPQARCGCGRPRYPRNQNFHYHCQTSLFSGDLTLVREHVWGEPIVLWVKGIQLLFVQDR